MSELRVPLVMSAVKGAVLLCAGAMVTAMMPPPLPAASASRLLPTALPSVEITPHPEAITWKDAGISRLGTARHALATARDQNPECMRGDLKQMSTSISRDDGVGHTRVKWDARNCDGILEIRGTARIAGDLSGFQSISPGGRVTIETREGNDRRKLTMTPSNGRFAYVYEFNGDRRNWDADGQRWLASVVALMVRRAGLGADERVEYLLREQGVAGVLREVDVIGSDHVQRRYIDLLLSRTALNGAAVRGLIEVAGREIESDHELAQVLATVTKKYGFTDESRTAYIKAVSTLSSDHEKGRALSALLDKASLTREDLITVLELTATMRSNHERAQVLKRVSRKADFSERRLQAAYVRAAASLESDYELGQVLSALVGRERLAPAAIDAVLTAAGSIGSDYERSRLLQQLLQTQVLNAAQRAEVVKLTDEIESEYERGKVATLLVKHSRN